MFQNTFLLRRSGVANFADIIKVSTMFIKPTFKDSRKVKRIRNYALKRNLYLYFSIKQKLLISGEKMLTSAELKRCVMLRPSPNRLTLQKNNAYIDFDIFSLYFIVVICKNFVLFQLINVGTTTNYKLLLWLTLTECYLCTVKMSKND